MFCVFDCDNARAWQERSFSNMFQNLLCIEGDDWTVIKLDAGEDVPSSVDQYSGIVITGSRHNCRDRATLPWFDPLCRLIQQIYDNGQPQLYGGCFGCQIIAHALGGCVDYNPAGKFLLKAEVLEITQSVADSLGVTNPTLHHLNIIVSHGDCVLELPQSAILLAKSSSCKHEIFSVGKETHNILACQSHPEFDLDYCIWQRIWPSVCSQNKLSESEQTEYRETLLNYSREQGADALIQLIIEFLHLKK